MTLGRSLPRILIIDDLFGRAHPDRRNEERANLCGHYLLEDVTGDELGKGTGQRIRSPVAQAVFCRGQIPACSRLGDTVENDLDGTLQVIRNGWANWEPGKPRWAMILLDLCFYTGSVTDESNKRTLGMPEGRGGDDDPQQYFGLRILQAIHDEFADLPVIILSSKSRNEVSREFSHSGALGFLPREDQQSPDLLKEYIWRHGLIEDEEGEVVGHSKALLLALRAARRAAAVRRNVLMRGERGTGKELLARYLHRQRTGQQAPFVVVNSSVLTPELFASELFGIEHRVATGVDRRDGLIRRADRGDLFFDEIGDMLPQVQAGVLRVLEERRLTPVGGRESQPVSVRFLSATNKDIELSTSTGNFRSDLLDRLREAGTILLPPLRERKEDIPLLVEKFVRDAERANPQALTRKVDPEALDKLQAHEWPGNVRELRDCGFNAVTNHPDVEYLMPVHIKLPEPQRQPKPPNPPPPPPRADNLDALLRTVTDFSFQALKPEHLAGKFSEVQSASARLIVGCLKAALEATRKPTPENPAGQILIHPAMKLITGNSGLTASQAADIIKRLPKLCPESQEFIMAEPVVKEAYETAVRLRPRQKKSRN